MRTKTITDIFDFKTTLKLISLWLLVVSADFLFYQQPAGWTYGLFGLLLILGCTAHNTRKILAYRAPFFACIAGLGLSLALMNNSGSLAKGLYTVTVFSLALLLRHPFINDIRQCLRKALLLAACSVGQFCRDSMMLAHIQKRSHALRASNAPLLKRWLMPVLLSGVFVLLFAQANPVITLWISSVNWDALAPIVRRCVYSSGSARQRYAGQYSAPRAH